MKQKHTLDHVLRRVFPEFQWDVSKFVEPGRIQHGYWSNSKNQRVWLDSIARELGVKKVSSLLSFNYFYLSEILLLLFIYFLKKLDDWYQVSRAQVMGLGGRNLFTYHSSMESVLRAAYPEHPWDSANFVSKKGHGYWQDDENISEALKMAEERLSIKRVWLYFLLFMI